MKIKIIAVGKLKEKYLKQGIAEYEKRLGKYCKFEIIEVPDEKAPENLSELEMIQVKEKEGRKILAKISDNDYVFALAIQGKEITSEGFANQIDQLSTRGTSSFTFVIGGSLGLSDEVMKRSDAQISFGRLTYPHQLMRLILTEQVYRAFRIIHGHAYHK
ncbi:23S rRNA (pseudouridine(1915)-N(3))-methyltransferase RlmH [Vagococcus carniphilus]|uniref:Ribosomal RNA large subunit methyltransferase H n=1 Tax=Vagococcus carniphilus TaxID=218144 RepID=A0AAW8U9Y2_9ENTE|nr:23S rRNA (pseudouridine(1915)-N(3))-methyltransferase RlmH [Vagococcus carniphilus]MDT2831927.1 23S rRNA (pseudouridine(1915)-N(3))-methyltransferase RlmH [Vagococcus carniphilus]MDT2833768.1 23S rRNA (pseudouridine(1915)-N(3))-methyltransferase RlmH [Vagococcus carniphilus]MDT2840773.1 23S rRNA (pseudouridine(1915)-N(3))-methyltransferase RlmH [Vagococcus carniphilus]MDT2855437.1 23S rRNA (pseudouridine(1915)-N(3))-methyltransferase RlmH [Vagococcus carniphilus]